ncbi:hypothetical protein [Streptomyces sp. NPDC018693]|uniref:hypothetical protein n=1 Tax=unclassified Streptomyces TaxID=2593676 RepID=UPI003799AAC2
MHTGHGDIDGGGDAVLLDVGEPCEWQAATRSRQAAEPLVTRGSQAGDVIRGMRDRAGAVIGPALGAAR